MKKQQDEQKRQLLEILFEMRSLPQDTTTEQMADFLIGRGVYVGKSDSGVGITKREAINLAEFLDMHLIRSIRDDPEIDNMVWLRDMVHAYDKLCEYSGYGDAPKEDEACTH